MRHLWSLPTNKYVKEIKLAIGILKTLDVLNTMVISRDIIGHCWVDDGGGGFRSTGPFPSEKSNVVHF